MQEVTATATLWGVLSFPVWAIGTLAVWANSRKPGEAWRPIALVTRRGGVSASLWSLSAAALLIWIPILPKTQEPLRLRQQVDALLSQGEVLEAVRLMSGHRREDFPPIWDPAPRPAFRENSPQLHSVLRATRDPQTAPWVRELYVDKVARLAESPYDVEWSSLPDEAFVEFAAALGELPADAKAVKMTAAKWDQILGRRDFSDERRKVILDQMATWGIEPTPRTAELESVEPSSPVGEASEQALQEGPETAE